MKYTENQDRKWPVTVLLVEDDFELAVNCRESLIAQGCFVYVAQDGSEALEALRRFRPDVIVMDSVMAGMDGLEALEEIKANHHTRGIPVIMLTGLAEYRGWAERLGADAFLTKPASGQALHRAIEGCLNPAACAA